MSLLERPLVNHSVLRLDDLDVDRPEEAARVGDVPPAVGEELPQVVATEVGSTDVIAELLLAVASGDREAFVALEHRIAGLVRLNILRVLRDAPRSDAVTQEFFAEVLRDAITFDPDRDSAQAWLLTRAHLRAMDGLRSGHAAVRERTDLATSVPDPVDDLGHEVLEGHPVQVTGAGALEVSGGPAALLHLLKDRR